MSSRIALITGGNRGLGYELCKALTLAGLRVVLGARDREHGRQAVQSLRADHGVEVDLVGLDVCSEDDVRAAVDWIDGEHGRVDVLINNATAAMDGEHGILDVELERVRETFEVNFYGPLRLCRACVPIMRRQGYGRIVNVSSGRGSFARLAADTPAYRMSKTALNALTRVLADELEGTGILVNAVSPGFMPTRLTSFRGVRSLAEGAADVVRLATLADDGPHGLFFIAGDRSPW